MKKIFYLDGGAGRIIAAIPAFLKYAKMHPKDDWSILIPAWDYLYWSIPELQDRTFGIDTKGIFDTLVKFADEIVTIEPYRVPGYYNQKLSMGEAIDLQINGASQSKLSPPILITSKSEKDFAKKAIEDIKKNQKKSKTIVFQPFGRGAKVNKDEGTVFDDEARSLSSKDYLFIAKKLALKYNIIFFGEPDFNVKSDTFTAKFQGDIRTWIAIVEASDYFVGCDSLGQHIARSVNTPGTVIFGSTFPINTSYPDYFNIIENKTHKKYSPIRLTGLDTMLANRLNENSMSFNEDELSGICDSIIMDIEKGKYHGESKKTTLTTEISKQIRTTKSQ
jgi:hypothetical protein